MSVIKETADAEQRLKELGIDLPQPPKPLGAYVETLRFNHCRTHVHSLSRLPVGSPAMTTGALRSFDEESATARCAARDASSQNVGPRRNCRRQTVGLIPTIRRKVREKCA
jgi:hypothetical protein